MKTIKGYGCANPDTAKGASHLRAVALRRLGREKQRELGRLAARRLEARAKKS